MFRKIAVFGALLVAACGADPIATENSGNGNVSIVMIATFDTDCKLFRVTDGTRQTIYVARCGGAPVSRINDVSSEWNVVIYCGKNCWRTERRSVQTVGG